MCHGCIGKTVELEYNEHFLKCGNISLIFWHAQCILLAKRFSQMSATASAG